MLCNIGARTELSVVQIRQFLLESQSFWSLLSSKTQEVHVQVVFGIRQNKAYTIKGLKSGAFTGFCQLEMTNQY